MKQIYLIHSSDARWVTQQRESLIDELVSRDMRDQNLSEVFPVSNVALRLGDVLPEVLSELSTIPFLADSRRVVVLHNLGDLLAGGRRKSSGEGAEEGASAPKKAKKRTPVEVLAAFVEQDLPATENVLVFSVIIDHSRGEYLDLKSPLYKLIRGSPLGEILKPARRENDPIFLMRDALLTRDTVDCLRHFRQVFREDAPGRVFREILKTVRLLVQANVLRKVEGRGVRNIETKYLPDGLPGNYYKERDFVRDKINGNLHRFQLRELIHAMERLLEINRVLYPSQSDPYVPDLRILLETFIVEFCEGTGQRS
ncbi:MAG TPA: hypothetical protein VM492_14590 [Sumerlaeia bacterium]|nr:hypothetical protein [Sumerlaeia bacterium]